LLTLSKVIIEAGIRDSGFGIRRAYKVVIPAKAGIHFDFRAGKQNGFRPSPE
jgi:hypothetical protein